MKNLEQREIYVTDGGYIVYPIANEDREHYVKLHRQLNGESTLFMNPICKDMMWESVLAGTDKVFSVYDADGDYCGSIELQHPESNTPELGVDLMEEKRNKGIAAKVIKLVAKRAYEDGKVEYFLIRVSSKNSHSKHVVEKMGVIPLKTVKKTFKSFIKEFMVEMDNVGEQIEGLFDSKDDLEEEIIYEYKYTPELFL